MKPQEVWPRRGGGRCPAGPCAGSGLAGAGTQVLLWICSTAGLTPQRLCPGAAGNAPPPPRGRNPFFANSHPAGNSRFLICFPGGQESCCFFLPLCTVGKSPHAGCLECTVQPEAASTGGCLLVSGRDGSSSSVPCSTGMLCRAVQVLVAPSTGPAQFVTQCFPKPEHEKRFGSDTSPAAPLRCGSFCWSLSSGFWFCVPAVDVCSGSG